MAEKFRYIPNDDTHNYPLCRLQLVVRKFDHSTKHTHQSNVNSFSKVVKPTNKKMLLYDFGD